MTNIKNFDPSLLGIAEMSLKGNDSVIYLIEYIKMQNLHNENIDRASYLYLVFDNVDGCIEESNEKKYLVFASTGKNMVIRWLLENCTELWG